MCIVVGNLAESRRFDEESLIIVDVFRTLPKNVNLSQKNVRNRRLTPARLRRENLAFANTGGISEHNRPQNFVPAFYDTETGLVAIARFADGTPAALHLLEGLPEEWIEERDASGRVLAIKDTVVSGFVREDRFYTRAQAAEAVGH